MLKKGQKISPNSRACGSAPLGHSNEEPKHVGGPSSPSPYARA